MMPLPQTAGRAAQVMSPLLSAHVDQFSASSWQAVPTGSQATERPLDEYPSALTHLSVPLLTVPEGEVAFRSASLQHPDLQPFVGYTDAPVEGQPPDKTLKKFEHVSMHAPAAQKPYDPVDAVQSVL
jgi:hypothetical protein